MKKNLLKAIIFILIFCILFYCVSKALWRPKTSISYFYDEPKNSLDLVYLGASNAYAHFNTVLAYDLYGYTTGMLSADSQPFCLTKYLIEESEKYQNPALYIIDLAKATDNINDFSGEQMRKTIDAMKFSKNRIDAINSTLKYRNDISKSEYINYYFSFLMYHNRWKEIEDVATTIYINTFKEKANLYKGFLYTVPTSVSVPQTPYYWNDKSIELSDETKIILDDLINYIKSKKVNVLFVVPKRLYTEETNGKLNKVIEILNQNDFKVINFNTLEDFNVDFSTDLYNDAHLNIYGSTKYTLYFAKYLKENYQLTDHRKDEKYNSWSKEYERFKEAYNRINNNNFDELLLEYKK